MRNRRKNRRKNSRAQEQAQEQAQGQGQGLAQGQARGHPKEKPSAPVTRSDVMWAQDASKDACTVELEKLLGARTLRRRRLRRNPLLAAHGTGRLGGYLDYVFDTAWVLRRHVEGPSLSGVATMISRKKPRLGRTKQLDLDLCGGGVIDGSSSGTAMPGRMASQKVLRFARAYGQTSRQL